MALEKGSEEWMFFSDFFQYCKKYWEISKEDNYWRCLINDSEELNKKYNTTYSKHIVLGFVNSREEEYKNKFKTE